MSFAANFPLFCIVLCLLCSVISSLLDGKTARRLSMVLTLLCAAAFLGVLRLVLSVGEPITYRMGHFPHPWGNEIRLGILESGFSAFFCIVLFLCLLGGKERLIADLEPEKSQLYYVMADLIQASLIVLCCTNDIFTGYVFIEICTIASCGILMIRQIARTTLASVRYMIFSLIGSGLFLLGVVVLYNITGHLLMPDLYASIQALAESGEYHIPLVTAICLITVGLAIKSGMFPFHFWMPDTYSYGTPCSSGILSGLVSKGYLFFLLKLIFNVFGTKVFYGSGVQNVLYLAGMCGIVFGSLQAIRENDIIRMLANSSAAQIGYIYMGIGISPTAGVLAALYHILTHAITKPALFFTASQMSDHAGSRRFRDLQGVGRVKPLAAALFTLCAFSMVGVPVTMGFLSKFLFAGAALATKNKLVLPMLVLAISTILNAVYFTRTIIRIYNTPEQPLHKGTVSPAFALSALTLTAMNLAAGIFASPLISLLEQGLAYFGKVG